MKKLLPVTLVAIAAIVYAIHAAVLSTPFYWDELGQFIPAALDIFRTNDWIPRSAMPNVHPPGTMAYLAGMWHLFGYSTVSTRAAMLLLAVAGAFLTYVLALRLSGSRVAMLALFFMLCDPLFYAQGMMAQLDMPVMVCVLAALILFLNEQHAAAALACTVAALTKETGILLPLVLMLVLLKERRFRVTSYYVVPAIALALWIFALYRVTGNPLGNAEFARYNLDYSVKPLRMVLSLARRAYYLFFVDLRWVGTIAILFARRCFATRAWRVTMLYAAGHIVLVSVLGGAELERYLLSVVPLFYIASAAAIFSLTPAKRYAAAAVMAAGLIAGIFLRSAFPLPYENNLAMVDFGRLQATAAHFVEARYPRSHIYTAWPLVPALRNPDFEYVTKPLDARETSDFRYSFMAKLKPDDVDVLVVYPRTWEPVFWILELPVIGPYLTTFYEWEPPMTSAQISAILKLVRVARWDRRGQWIEVWAKP